MLRATILGAILLTSLGAASASAQPNIRPPQQRPDRLTRLANEWVQLYLRRNATPRELQLLTNKLRLGASPAAVQATILGSDEYFIRNNRNYNMWAQSVVRDVLGRNPTINEVALLQNAALRYGRAYAAQLVLESINQPTIPPPWVWF